MLLDGNLESIQESDPAKHLTYAGTVVCQKTIPTIQDDSVYCDNGFHMDSAGTCVSNLPDGFTTIWKVGASGYGDGNNTIAFGVTGSGATDIFVDWGDGTTETKPPSTTLLIHTYTNAGDKTIKLRNITRFYNSYEYVDEGGDYSISF